jgi:predicted nucleic acid-binding protein
VRIVLADTGPLYALTDTDDRHHRRALAELARLSGSGSAAASPLPVLCESYGLILKRLGSRPAIAWWRRTHSGGLGLLNPTREDYVAAAALAARHQDQAISLFDGLLAVLSDRLAAPVWTFDHHFDLLRVDVWRPE